MAEIRISDMTTATSVNDTDLVEIAQVDGNSSSGYATKKTTILAIATKILKGISFSDLATTSKQIIAAINELKNNKIDSSDKGTAGGVAELDSNGHVPASQLPSSVDDIVEGYYYNGKFYEEDTHETEIPAEAGKIYIDLSSNNTYRWGGSVYVEISPSLSLGETSTTAYRGDRGKVAYDHATEAGRETTARNLGLYKFSVTSEGHVGAGPEAAQKSDFTALGLLGEIDDALSSTSENPVKNNALYSAFQDKANTTGTYAGITSGKSQTVHVPVPSSVGTKSNPYMRRQIPYNTAEAETMQIVGATVNGNQLVDTSTTSVTIPSGHKYIAKISGVWSIGASDGTAITVDGSNGDMLTDLTQWFGSTAIPDYAYTLEQTESGSGIAWLKSQGFFNEDYIGYRANGLESVNVSEKINVGKNIIDVSDTMASASTNVFEKTNQYKAGTYALSFDFNGTAGNVRLYVYDKSNTRIINNLISATNTRLSSSFTTTVDIGKIILYTGVAGTFSNIQLEFGSTATPYEPYTETHIPFDTSKTLRGRYILDGDVINAVGDIYKADGTIMRNYAEVDLGTLVWTYNSEYNYFTSQTNIGREVYPIDNTTVPNFLCNKYLTSTNAQSSSKAGAKDDKTIFAKAGENQIIYIKDSAYTYATEFVSSLNGVKLVYKKATPTTDTAAPFTANQIIDGAGTEEFTDYGVESGSRDFAVPPGNVSNYYAYTDGSMTIPAIPPADGDYEMKLHVSGGVRTFTWE